MRGLKRVPHLIKVLNALETRVETASCSSPTTLQDHPSLPRPSPGKVLSPDTCRKACEAWGAEVLSIPSRSWSQPSTCLCFYGLGNGPMRLLEKGCMMVLEFRLKQLMLHSIGWCMISLIGGNLGGWRKRESSCKASKGHIFLDPPPRPE